MDLDPETRYTCSLGCKANRRERVEGRNELKFGGEKSKTIADSKLSERSTGYEIEERTVTTERNERPPAGKAHAAKRSPPDRTHLGGIVAGPRVASIFTNRLLMQQDVYTRYRCRRGK